MNDIERRRPAVNRRHNGTHVPVQAWVPPDVRRRAKLLAVARGVSVSEVIECALRALLAREMPQAFPDATRPDDDRRDP